MEYPLSISLLNDFIFCPMSIYFHSLDIDTDKLFYQEEAQLNGTKAHEKCDKGEYSDRVDVLQGCSVYCEKYNLFGKIDTFDISKGILTERKNKIINIYDGYIFQLYAQYFALMEQGYAINSIRFYSVSDNKVYIVNKPEDDIEMFNRFEYTIRSLQNFTSEGFKQNNKEKCKRCIYALLCNYC